MRGATAPEINWTTPAPNPRAGLKQRGATMKVKLGDREIEVHPMVDVPKLAAIHSLAFANMGEAFQFRPMKGEPVELRYGDADALLRQALDAA
jgi:hypothetical protein